MENFIATYRPDGVNETRDCTVLAISNALNVAYHTAHTFLADNGRKPKHGIRLGELVTRKRGVILDHKLTLVKRSGSLAKFLREFPQGRFIVLVRIHAFAVIDGVVHDYSEQPPGKHIRKAWRVEPFGSCREHQLARWICRNTLAANFASE